MAAVIKGKGVVWSVGGLVYSGGILDSTATEAAQQSQRLARTSEKAELKDIGGSILAQVFHGFRKTLSITVIPYHDTTIAGANTASDAWTLKPSNLVTIVDTAGDFPIAEDNYNVISATQGRTVDGLATIDMELEAGDESPIEIATAPIA